MAKKFKSQPKSEELLNSFPVEENIGLDCLLKIQVDMNPAPTDLNGERSLDLLNRPTDKQHPFFIKRKIEFLQLLRNKTRLI